MKAVVSIGLMVVTAASAALAKCVPVKDTQPTWWGHVITVKHNEPVRKLRGIVLERTSLSPFGGVRVQVFDHPELVLDERGLPKMDRTGQNQLAQCVTSADGTFSFDLPPGHYEVRCSKPREWDCISILVEVKKKARDRGLKIQMRLSD